MRKVLCVIVFIFLSISCAYAYTGFGICNFGKGRIDYIICYGPTVLNETVVKEYVKVAGPLNARKSVLGSVLVTGAAYLEDTIVKGPVKVVGKVVANRVTFTGNLDITSNTTLLNHSMVNGSIVVNSEKEGAFLALQCGTQISGSIKFKGAKGLIKTSGDSIVHGKVENASTEFVQRMCD